MTDIRTPAWLGSGPPISPPSPRSSRPRRRRVLSVRRLRRLGAALLVGLAAWLALDVLAPPPPPHTVMTLASDRPAGHVLTDADVRQVQVEGTLLPGDALVDPRAVTGRRLARSLSAHTILTRPALVPAHDISPTERALHVPVPDPGALGVIRDGDRVDLVEASKGTVVATGVRILAVDDPAAEGSGHGLLVAVPASALPQIVPAMAASGPGIVPALRTVEAPSG